MRHARRGPLALAVVAGLAMTAGLMGAKDSSCVPVPTGCVTHDDCGEGMYCDAGVCETLGACQTAEDCDGQPIIVPLCVGHFTCEANRCNWHCGTNDTCDPREWEACGAEAICVADDADEEGSCGPFAHGQNVGAGYACGGSIGVGCADGLYCKGLPHGMVGGTGLCTDMSCDDWAEEYGRLVDYVGQCNTADDCAPVPGTSCGCTRNLVLNANMDLSAFWELWDAMFDDGCGFFTTCDCPPADGLACENGRCTWNYL